MKQLMIKLKGVAMAALTMAASTALLPAQAEDVSYLAPVYKGTDNNPTNGIARWETKSISTYTLVEDASSRVTWGVSGKTNWYVVAGSNVQLAGGASCVGHVNLILCDGAKLTIKDVANGKAGISTDTAGSFTIYAQQAGTGILISAAGGGATGSVASGAGIGGDENKDGCNITINGGYVTATSTTFIGGAGIGGGANASGSNIVINAGVVTTQTYLVDSGAGIGSGCILGVARNIVINGGYVTASGSGGGIGGKNGLYDLTINDGIVVAMNAGIDDLCPCIGATKASSASVRNITINGGEVTAISSGSGAGIGTCAFSCEVPVENITINGGKVTATSEEGGAGIGTGKDSVACVVQYITINGGTVIATGNNGGAGIGGGRADESGFEDESGFSNGTAVNHIYINGGTVIATGLGSICKEWTTTEMTDGHFEWVDDEEIWIEGGEEEVQHSKTFYASGIGNGAGGTCSDIKVATTMGAKVGTESQGQATSMVVNGGGDLAGQFESKSYAITAPLIQVGSAAYAFIVLGTCEIQGSGATWNSTEWTTAGNPLAAYKNSITNVMVVSGVTGIGSNFFDGFRTIRDVTLGATCTSIGSQAFLECWRLTNVVSTAATMNVGAHAFYSCNSLEAMAFGANPTFGEKAFSLQSAIYMKNGMPQVYAIPQITISGYTEVLKGSNDLQNWVTVTDETKPNYHFFKIVMEKKN